MGEMARAARRRLDETRFSHGWLERQMHSAHIDCMASHSPGFYEGAVAGPRSGADEQDLFDRLNKRFEEWTGKTFEEFLRNRAALTQAEDKP